MAFTPPDAGKILPLTAKTRRPELAPDTEDRPCPVCGGQVFGIAPRSINPLYLRCCQCGTEITVPARNHRPDGL
jgi:hypothetical protein